MSLKNTFVHHVHFWLKDKADQPKLIEGVPADTNRDVIDRSYDVSLLLLFDGPAEQEAYQNDPTHVLFADNYAKTLCAKVVVQDCVNV
jgi:hypothetical protein